MLHATAVPARVETYWTPAPPEPIRYRRDEEYAEHLTALLGDAVEARLRSSTRVGVSLSGGMDSPSVAALASERLNRHGGAPPLASFSWVFDELPECDERRWIEPLVSHLGLEATYVIADPHGPLRDADTWPVDPSSPLSNPYERLHQALWAAASGRGVRTLLVGTGSDRLFSGRESWLAARVGRGHWGDLFAHLAGLASGGGALRPWRDPALRALLRQVLPRRVRRGHRAPRPPWLTPRAWALAEGSLADSSVPPAGIAERRAASVFSDRNRMRGGAGYPVSRAPVELRDPFRDLRVVHFMLAVPPDQLWRGSARKFILQRAMRGRLPAAILERTTRTPLDPFFRRQLFEREAPTLEARLRAPDALWRGRIDEDWLLGAFPGRFRQMSDGPGLLVPWFAVAADLWNRTPGRGLYSGRSRIGYTPAGCGSSDSARTQGCEERDG
jgi:asparagine synthase (glutamine-hydrolysing)